VCWQSFAKKERDLDMPHIPYFPVEQLDDPELRAYLEHAAANSTPRPEIQAIRAHVPEILRAFGATWDRVFRNGVVDHRIKELCRVYVSSTLECHY
jgi:alkylhydroperoxidase/carboxymuconolactone decarboxylase family protein YurZ